jgi:hypothetical protein
MPAVMTVSVTIFSMYFFNGPLAEGGFHTYLFGSFLGGGRQIDLFVVSPVPLMNGGIRVFAASNRPFANSD